jgi:hypothetical protein
VDEQGLTQTGPRLPDRYRVEREIGRGGMATVFLAADTVRGTPVAVKVLRENVASMVAVERFIREIRHQTHVRHDHVAPVLDAGEAAGIPFYVLPWYSGGSLRRRMRAESTMSLGDTIAIVTDVAKALDAAHIAGVVHRDVKPENILLNESGAHLSDFGIAKAIEVASGAHLSDRAIAAAAMAAGATTLTEPGVVLGTPGYMSPEQSAGEGKLDPRSDLYSLACVAFECLAGETPFTGPTPQAISNKRATLPVPSLRLLRDTLPESIDDVFRRALARVPADRYASAGAFANALAALPTEPTRPRLRPRAAVAGGLLAFVALALFVRALSGSAKGVGDVGVEVLALHLAADVPGETSERTRRSLGEWTDLTVRDLVPAPGPWNLRDAAARARKAGATRLLLVAGTGNAVRAQLVSAVGSVQVLREARLARDPAAALDSLLLDGTGDPERPVAGARRSLRARREYLEGRRALGRWELPMADSLFSSAMARDSTYLLPRVGLAMVRAWSSSDIARWRIAAEQAMLGAGRLPAPERAIATALVAQARNDLGAACPAWESAIAADSLNALAWYGAAACHAEDDVVQPDRESPSGFRFRTSYHRALMEYQRAFVLLPSILTTFNQGSFESLRRLFKTSGADLRRGRSVNAPVVTYAANPSWAGDTLAFIPVPKGATSPHQSRNRHALNEALRRQRELVRDVTSSWVAAYPQSPDAWQALALSLALLGDPAALDTITRASALVRQAPAAQRGRVVAAELGLQLAFGVSTGDTTRLLRARHLADSLLGAPPGGDPLVLASVAALTGRATLAVQYASSPRAASALGVPPALRRDIPGLLVLGAMGGPVDSLALLESRATALLAREVSPADLPARRAEFLARAVSMAFPAYRSPSLPAYGREGDPLCAAQALWMEGDQAATRRAVDGWRAARAGILPESIQLDALAPEAALLSMLGDWAGVEDWIGPTLSALAHEAPRLVNSPLRSASLVRTIMLRALAAKARGAHAEARRHARAAEILWGNADTPLQEAVTEMRRMRAK